MLTAGFSATPVVHRLYGIRVRTPWPVPGVRAYDEHWDVEFVADAGEVLDGAALFVPLHHESAWAQSAALPDGSAFRRWQGLFEFLVTPDARRIYARTLGRVDDEALLAYLLVDALSFSLVRLGSEPLHATAVLTQRGVAAFLGNSGNGKSTLAALLVSAGCTLVTDDMLVLARTGPTWMAQPGPPRLKLYREMSHHILGSTYHGVPMNATTTKLIIPLDDSRVESTGQPLTVIYLLASEPEDNSAGPTIRRLSPAAAFPRLLAQTAAHYPSETARLRRQFEFATRLVQDVPVKLLSYRRDRAEMATLRDAVLADVSRLM